MSSLFVNCEGEADLDAAFAHLFEGSAVLRPLGKYGFSTRFAWVSYCFSVTWQLNLECVGSGRLAGGLEKSGPIPHDPAMPKRSR